MYQMIVSDLDETLLSSQKEVTQKNREAIASIMEKGIQFVCSTGRPFYSIDKTLKAINQYQKEDTLYHFF